VLRLPCTRMLWGGETDWRSRETVGFRKGHGSFVTTLTDPQPLLLPICCIPPAQDLGEV